MPAATNNSLTHATSPTPVAPPEPSPTPLPSPVPSTPPTPTRQPQPTPTERPGIDPNPDRRILPGTCPVGNSTCSEIFAEVIFPKLDIL